VHPRVADVRPRSEDVVVLATKCQDTAGVLAELTESELRDQPVLCAQNGVANEPAALRVLRRVYGVVVMSPTAYLSPGTVLAYSTPLTGLLDVGRYPTGEDEVSRGVASVLGGASYDARSIPDVRRWKYAKLITNLGNAVEVLCGPQARGSSLTERLQQEGREVLTSAVIDFASEQEDRQRRGTLLRRQEIDGSPRPGASMWQSVVRGTGATEVDYLNGEVVALGRLHGTPAPANALVQQLTREVANGDREAFGFTPEQILERLA